MTPRQLCGNGRPGPRATGSRTRISLVSGAVSIVIVLPLVAQDRAPDPRPPRLDPPTVGTDSTSRGTGFWRDALLGAAVLGTAFLLDEPVRDLALDLRGGVGRDLATVGGDYGAWKKSGPIILGGGLLIGAALDGSTGVRKTAAAAVGVLAGSLANEALNRTLGRRRPREDMGAWQFDPFHGHASLGSGHTAYAFAIAGAIDEVTEGWWAAPFYAAAAGTGLARIHRDRHWLSDVVVGGFIGLWVGRRTTRAAARRLGVEAREAGEPPGSLLDRLEPVFGGGVAGLGLKL